MLIRRDTRRPNFPQTQELDVLTPDHQWQRIPYVTEKDNSINSQVLTSQLPTHPQYTFKNKTLKLDQHLILRKGYEKLGEWSVVPKS